MAWEYTCLRDNPFIPSIADARTGRDIILNGTKHEGIANTISSYIRKYNTKAKMVITLLGRIGSGKTSIIKKALYDSLNIENIRLNEVRYIKTNNKSYIVGYFAPEEQNISTEDMLKRIVLSLLDEIKKSEKKTNEIQKIEGSKLNVLRHKLVKAIMNSNTKFLIIIIDQIERLKIPISKEIVSSFIRELSNELSTQCGLIFIFSAIPREDITKLFEDFQQYITVHSYQIDFLTKREAKEVLKYIFQYYRLDIEECKQKSVNEPYYPFKEDAIDYILSLIEARTELGGEKKISPRSLYIMLDRILTEAKERGEIPISKQSVEYILEVLPEISYIVNWYRYLASSNIMLSSNDIVKILKYVLNYASYKNIRVKEQYEVKVVTDIKNTIKLLLRKTSIDFIPFKFKNNTKRIDDLVKSIDLLVYLEAPDGRGKIYLIRIRRLGPQALSRLIDMLNSIDSIVIKGDEYRLSRNVVLKIIHNGPISSQLGDYINYLNSLTKITVEHPFILDYQIDPLTYGAFLYIRDIIEKHGYTYSNTNMPIELKYTVKHIIDNIFEFII